MHVHMQYLGIHQQYKYMVSMYDIFTNIGKYTDEWKWNSKLLIEINKLQLWYKYVVQTK